MTPNAIGGGIVWVPQYPGQTLEARIYWHESDPKGRRYVSASRLAEVVCPNSPDIFTPLDSFYLDNRSTITRFFWRGFFFERYPYASPFIFVGDNAETEMHRWITDVLTRSAVEEDAFIEREGIDRG